LRGALAQELNAALQEMDGPAAPVRAVHRCRVRLKRARALGRVGKAAAPGLAVVFNDTARAVMRQLGRARDLSALADTARMLAETADERGAAALLRVAEALEAAREAPPAIDLDSVRAGIRDLLALAQVWPEPSPRQVRAGAMRIVKRARRARRRGQGAQTAKVRHEWRKREKDRLYAAVLLDKAWPAPRRRKQSETIGQLLGMERDALLLMERLEAAPALAGDSAAAAHAQRLLRKHNARVRRRADKIGERLHARGV